VGDRPFGRKWIRVTMAAMRRDRANPILLVTGPRLEGLQRLFARRRWELYDDRVDEVSHSPLWRTKSISYLDVSAVRLETDGSRSFCPVLVLETSSGRRSRPVWSPHTAELALTIVRQHVDAAHRSAGQNGQSS
jgi:hypothetical protein